MINAYYKYRPGTAEPSMIRKDGWWGKLTAGLASANLSKITPKPVFTKYGVAKGVLASVGAAQLF